MTSYKVKQPLEDAVNLANAVKMMMFSLGFKRVEIVGSIRRKEAMVGDIDIVADGNLLDLRDIEWVKEFVDWKRGGTESATFIFKGQQVNVIRSDEDSWGAATFYLTGPAMYQVAYRARAKKMGMCLNQTGLYDSAGRKIAGQTEEEIYTSLGKNYKEPWERGK